MNATAIELADCTEFRQTLAARPPAIVHGATLLLVTLLAALVTWSWLVKANLVVRATGRVRPAEVPVRVFTSATADLVGRVVEAPFQEGDVVRRGDVLVRLDTAQIDNRIDRLQRTLTSSEEELARLATLENLLVQQLDTARAKAQVEVSQAEATLARAIRRRDSEIRRQQAELKALADLVKRNRRLGESRVVSQHQLIQSESELRQAEEKLVQAQLPVDEAPVAVARRAAALVESDFAVRQAELDARRVVKQGEAEAARKDLANLQIQRQEAVLRSPIDGVVVAGLVRPGDVLEPGKPVLEIARQESLHFEALVASEDVGNLRVGMPVNLKFDAFDYQTYGMLPGEVTYLSPDSKVSMTGAQDASVSSPRDKSRAAFVVRIKMHGDEFGHGDFRGHAKLGLSGTAEIVVARKSVLLILVQQIRHTLSLG